MIEKSFRSRKADSEATNKIKKKYYAKEAQF